MTADSVWIQNLTWEEVEQHVAQDDVVFLPIGSTDQHGPADCLGAVAYVAITLVEDAAERRDVLCAPPIWYGDSSRH